MSNDGVRLQNLCDFTVQIRRPSDDAIVGTGIAVSMDGQVVTCAHVVGAALEGTPARLTARRWASTFPRRAAARKRRGGRRWRPASLSTMMT